MPNISVSHTSRQIPQPLFHTAQSASRYFLSSTPFPVARTHTAHMPTPSTLAYPTPASCSCHSGELPQSLFHAARSASRYFLSSAPSTVARTHAMCISTQKHCPADSSAVAFAGGRARARMRSRAQARWQLRRSCPVHAASANSGGRSSTQREAPAVTSFRYAVHRRTNARRVHAPAPARWHIRHSCPVHAAPVNTRCRSSTQRETPAVTFFRQRRPPSRARVPRACLR